MPTSEKRPCSIRPSSCEGNHIIIVAARPTCSEAPEIASNGPDYDFSGGRAPPFGPRAKLFGCEALDRAGRDGGTLSGARRQRRAPRCRQSGAPASGSNLGRQLLAVSRCKATLADTLAIYEQDMTRYGFEVVRGAARKGAMVIGYDPVLESSIVAEGFSGGGKARADDRRMGESATRRNVAYTMNRMRDDYSATDLPHEALFRRYSAISATLAPTVFRKPSPIFISFSNSCSKWPSFFASASGSGGKIWAK